VETLLEIVDNPVNNTNNITACENDSVQSCFNLRSLSKRLKFIYIQVMILTLSSPVT